jgi:hypothetical protein
MARTPGRRPRSRRQTRATVRSHGGILAPVGVRSALPDCPTRWRSEGPRRRGRRDRTTRPQRREDRASRTGEHPHAARPSVSLARRDRSAARHSPTRPCRRSADLRPPPLGTTGPSPVRAGKAQGTSKHSQRELRAYCQRCSRNTRRPSQRRSRRPTRAPARRGVLQENPNESSHAQLARSDGVRRAPSWQLRPFVTHHFQG